MCGIVGVISRQANMVTESLLQDMTDAIYHRGPDGEGHWISEIGNIGFGHRRLSVIDLSNAASQPMYFQDKYVMVFNGEIYNYLELKEELLCVGYHFRSGSDTEILMAMYDRYKEKCLSFLDGMFAFALYDKEKNTVFCARDRFGEKPFYYSFSEGNHFYFGSEMKALKAATVPTSVNHLALYNYISFAQINNPHNAADTFYINYLQLETAHYLIVDLASLSITTQQYYQISSSINDKISFEDAAEQFKHLFTHSVKRRLRTDVPLGTSLSGGLDSSLIVCTVDRLISHQTHSSFSAIFPGFERNEKKYIHYVTNVVNTKPFFVEPNESSLLEDLDKICWHQEEPFGSSSIYVQYCVMRLVKEQGVTVLLDGQGADEILGGYHHYFNSFFNEIKRNYSAQYEEQHDAYQKLHSSNSINELYNSSLKNKLKNKLPSFYNSIKTTYANAQQIKSNMYQKEFYEMNKQAGAALHLTNQNTLNNHLLDSIAGELKNLLRYADRNSMAFGREVRLPFLNHELVDFLFTLPPQFKINNGWTKYILRKSFEDILPKEIAWRKDKIGFEPPQKNWLNNKKINERILDGLSLLVSNKIFTCKYQNKLTKPDALSNISHEHKWKLLMAGQFVEGGLIL